MSGEKEVVAKKPGTSETEKLPGVFWDGVEVLTYHHQHVRVSELKGEIRYQFKLSGSRVLLRTVDYMLTTRPAGTNWKRANINFELRSLDSQRVNSPDTMQQDTQRHPYNAEASVNFSAANGASFRVGVQYDGTNNDTSETDHWGPWREIIPRG